MATIYLFRAMIQLFQRNKIDTRFLCVFDLKMDILLPHVACEISSSCLQLHTIISAAEN